MVSRNQILIIVVPLIIIIGALGYYYTNKPISPDPDLAKLNNNATILELVRSNKNVTYTYIKLYPAGESVTWQIHFPASSTFWPGYKGPEHYTKYIRTFEAFQYPPDTTLPKENRKIIGFVDSNLRVWTWAELRGDEFII